MKRTAVEVENKIKRMLQVWKDCHDWVQNTGQGVCERDGEVYWMDCVVKRCYYYVDLVDVLGQVPTSKPLLTNDEDFLNNDEKSSNVADDDNGTDEEPSEEEEYQEEYHDVLEKNTDAIVPQRFKKTQIVTRPSGLNDTS